MRKRSVEDALMLGLVSGLLLPMAAWGARYDSLKLLGGALAPTASPRPSPEAEPRARARRLERAKIPELSAETEDKLVAAVNGLTVILQRTPNGEGALRLHNSRAQAHLSIAQRRILRTAGKEMDAATRSHLLAARADLDRILEFRSVRAEARANALFLRGLTASYSGDESGAVKSFEEAIRVAPSSRHHGWMAYYAADFRYESGDYRSAVALIREGYARMEPSLRLMALYRLAWSYLNLHDLKAARAQFIDLLQKSQGQPIQTDVLRDLAFLLSRESSEPEILRVADEKISTPALKLAFLRMVHSNLEAQGRPLGRSAVFQKLLQIEPELSRRIQLGVGALSAARRSKPLVEGFGEFIAFRKMLQREDVTPDHPAFRANADRIDLEIRSLIRANVETFSGKIQSLEEVERGQLSHNLRELFSFYQQGFPASPLRPIVFGLWIDVCADSADWECVSTTSETVLADPGSNADFKRRALLDGIAGLEELNRKEPAAYRARLIAAIDRALGDEASPEWARLAARLGELRLDEKDHEGAVRLFDRIFTRIANVENFYRLQWARYQAGEYQEVLRDRRGDAFREQTDTKLVELRRESALKLAIQAREKKDLKAYTESMQAFLASSPDPAKARLARKDYLFFLLEKNLTTELFAELMKQPAADRYSAEFEPLVRGAAAVKLRAGDFTAARQLLETDGSPDREIAYMRAIALIASGQPGTWEKSLDSLAPERREYLLSVLALLKPGFVVRNFRKHELADLAVRIERGRWEAAPAAQQPVPNALEKEIAAVRVPRIDVAGAGAEKKFAQALQSAVKGTRVIRGKLTKLLAGRSASEQLRTLSAAQSLETAIAQAILGSSSTVPAGLTPEQARDYQAGLQNFAAEFSGQAELLAPLVLKAKEAVKNEQDRAAALQMPQPLRGNWPWPSAWNSESFSRAAALLDAGNALGALLLVDLLRDSALSSEEDYLWIRAGILLLGMPSEAMRRYVLQELKSRGQNGLIEKWRKLT